MVHSVCTPATAELKDEILGSIISSRYKNLVYIGISAAGTSAGFRIDGSVFEGN